MIFVLNIMPLGDRQESDFQFPYHIMHQHLEPFDDDDVLG
jgi:hypothetical protein